MKKITITTGLGLLLTAASLAVLAEPAIVVNKADVKDAPQFQANTIQNLNKDDKVDIKRRERAWYLLNAATSDAMTQDGWINMLSVRYDVEPINQRSTSLLSRLGLKKGHDNITATTGVRGMTEAEITAAEPSFEALMFAQKYMVTAEDAKNFAAQVALKSQQIDYPEVQDDKD